VESLEIDEEGSTWDIPQSKNVNFRFVSALQVCVIIGILHDDQYLMGGKEEATRGEPSLFEHLWNGPLA